MVGADTEAAAAARVTAVTQKNAGGDSVSLVFVHRSKRGNADCTPSISTGPSTAQILVHSHAQTPTANTDAAVNVQERIFLKAIIQEQPNY